MSSSTKLRMFLVLLCNSKPFISFSRYV